MQKDGNWDPVRAKLFAHPGHPQACPFCGKMTVRAAWGLYSLEPRAASFDAWCTACGEKHHCAALLPPEAPDSFPPGSMHVDAQLTQDIFDRGKKAKWW